MNFKQLIYKYYQPSITRDNYNMVLSLALYKMHSTIINLNDELFEMCEDLHEYIGSGGLPNDYNDNYKVKRDQVKKLQTEYDLLKDCKYGDLTLIVPEYKSPFTDNT